ncbi:MAG TPA: ATP-dependent RNA helicase SrmB, partial [Idiomarina baltica]|nr:ATP-dependent RNA helicase SrmB [Idiomarina baltica]
RMLDMGFKDVVKDIALHARNRQHAILCSATIESDGVKAFSRALLNEPELIEVTPPKRERGKIIEHAYLADTDDHKRQLLMALLKQHSGRSIVFARTRERVQALASFLQSQDVPVMFLRGDLPHAERQQKIIEFKRRDNAVLVATDVASRGLDIDDIKLVINYDLPKQADVYVHRIGRTARAGQKGLAISLVEAHDALLLGKIERYMEHRLDRRVIDGLKPQYKFPSTDKKRVKKKKQNKKTKKRR